MISGWRPGMPVQLPTDLSILPPARWKPGDTVSLRPLDALPVPPRMVERQPQPVHVPGLTNVPQTIMVRHVKLDFSDGTSSSECSSDVMLLMMKIDINQCVM